ncbi:Two component system response regulator, sigma factor 54 interaction domain-containing [Desulfonema limicola]|uniref:Two component system response regulator, sigma factor 54 interaction domain-containing n=1 Tax=Desulfonema limicola TaxID=45656 RepID=A0A975BBF9_9BACT|nr:sigma-54 dependent transcriptional regulator [Desulfonema limicola]QTA82594.1 Two component system response regulator, sigma factor 54 interaction domain-containing [Desulfonema limicola]
MNSVLVISAVSDAAGVIRSALHSDFNIKHANDKEEALDILKKKRYDIIFIDIVFFSKHFSDKTLKEGIRPFKALYPTIEIVVIAPQEMIREAVKAVKAGASDYLTYPVIAEEVKLVTKAIRDAALMASELEYLRNQQWKDEALEIVSTKNPRMQEVFRKIRAVAPTKTTVLLIGETGVGKGVLAKLIHQHSNRESAQFISVHCGAIPDSLVESELFGHEKGAFTGAVRKKMGKFEIALDGTIFMDEIGTVTSAVQIKLLQVLQDGLFSRVGGESVIKSGARVIAATNSDLKEMSDNGSFRKDLYYRLNVFPIEIPTLRERAEDIPWFAEHFLKKMNLMNQKGIYGIHPLVTEALKKYSWPGNIRELENLIERAYILESSSILTPDVFPDELFDPDISTGLPVNASLPLAEARRQVIEDFERQYLKEVLSRNMGRINKSSEEAGISTRQLHKLMLKYGIRKEEYKRLLPPN